MLLFVLLVLAQAVIFNRIWLFHFALPFVFIFFILSLPAEMDNRWVLTLSFVLGFCVDVFSDTLGLNAMCCTMTGGCRSTVIKLYTSREDDLGNSTPSPSSMGWIVYAKYLITMTLLYSLFFFIVLSFEFFDFPRLGLKIIGSALLTFIIILALSNFLVPGTVNRK